MSITPHSSSNPLRSWHRLCRDELILRQGGNKRNTFSSQSLWKRKHLRRSRKPFPLPEKWLAAPKGHHWPRITASLYEARSGGWRPVTDISFPDPGVERGALQHHDTQAQFLQATAVPNAGSALWLISRTGLLPLSKFGRTAAVHLRFSGEWGLGLTCGCFRSV